MKKIISLLAFLILSFVAVAQNDSCQNPVGPIYSDSCIQYPITPPASVGQMITKCFTYQATAPGINLGFVYLNSTCGPFAPYTQLSYVLYDLQCDTLFNGNIFPNPNNTFAYPLVVGQTYVLCLTWDARCTQFTACATFIDSPLPVELISFYANTETGHNVLHWSTASETASDRYEVQRGADGIGFMTIGTVKAAGYSTSTKEYYYDDATATGVVYYRLLQVDIDGKNKSYGPICVSSKGNVKLYPNPNNGTFTIAVWSHGQDVMNLNITDVKGNSLFKKSYDLVRGDNQIVVIMPDPTDGMIFVNVTTLNNNVLFRVSGYK